MLIRKNDQVVVISGTFKPGKKSKEMPHHRVLKVFPKSDKILVEGVNYVWKHMRRSDKNPTGGRIKKEAPIHISNIMLWCDKCARPVKAHRMPKDGIRVRVCRVCSEPIQPRKKK
jgi:large subunit ribosomal protein L24